MHRPVPHRNGSSESPLRTLVLLLPSPIDCEAFSLWCQYRVGCDVVEWATNLEEGIECCRRIQPRLMVIDPSISCGAVERAVALVREESAGHLLVLDSRPMEVRLAAILSEPGTSYFSRTASSQALSAAMADMLLNGRRVFDPALAPRIRRTERGYQLDYAGDQRSISILSQREQQVSGPSPGVSQELLPTVQRPGYDLKVPLCCILRGRPSGPRLASSGGASCTLSEYSPSNCSSSERRNASDEYSRATSYSSL